MVGVLVGVFVTVLLELLVAVGVDGHPGSTVTVPVMKGWIVHRYE